MRRRRNDLEIMNWPRELLRRPKTRIDLLFTMSDIPHHGPVGRKVRSDVSRTARPWRVFVREERETKTAKSRQWSSTDLAICWPLMFQKRFDKSKLLKNHP